MKKKPTNVFIRLWQHFSQKRRKQLYVIAFLTITSSIAEIICLISIVPFIAIITSPATVLKSKYLAKFNFSASDLILPLTIAFAICSLIAGVLRLILIKRSITVANATSADLSINIYQKTLYQPYATHIARNSSDIISAIAQKSTATTSVIVSLVTFATTTSLFIAIIIAMLAVNTKITLLAALIITLAYLTIGKFTKQSLAQNGSIIAKKQNDVMQSLQEGLGAIRDILLDGSQENYTQNYAAAANELQKSRAENMFITQSPRYIIETFAMILIAIFVLITSYNDHKILDSLPLFGFFTLSAQRLLPLIQQMYGYWSEIIGNKASLADIIELLDQSYTKINAEPAPINLHKQIILRNISFKYSPDAKDILQNINIQIPKGARVGIIGSTGSGKSTLLDILMGLIEPTCGELIIDQQVINQENCRAWQEAIAHVPQSIFLANLTIAENIAFGIPKENIDQHKLETAAIRANAHEFIKQCPHGYATKVGERGVRLSGGQRQRIGIARALYKNASVLCLDEATSALDSTTENAVMRALENLDEELTIFIIAHRLSTLENCSHIINVDKKQVIFSENKAKILVTN